MQAAKEMYVYLINGLVIIGFLLISTIAITKIIEKHDKDQFNNGICINCGEKLEQFNVDKYGNVVWLCDDCGYNCVH